MTNWKEAFPFNTFEGETKQQIVSAVESLLKKQKLNIIDNINNELQIQSGPDGLSYKYKELILNS